MGFFLLQLTVKQILMRHSTRYYEAYRTFAFIIIDFHDVSNSSYYLYLGVKNLGWQAQIVGDNHACRGNNVFLQRLLNVTKEVAECSRVYIVSCTFLQLLYIMSICEQLDLSLWKTLVVARKDGISQKSLIVSFSGHPFFSVKK